MALYTFGKPGYVIAQINLKNKEGYKEYVDKVPAIIKNFGGEYLVKAGEFKSIEGKWDFTRNVVIKFPSYKKHEVPVHVLISLASQHNSVTASRPLWWIMGVTR